MCLLGKDVARGHVSFHAYHPFWLAVRKLDFLLALAHGMLSGAAVFTSVGGDSVFREAPAPRKSSTVDFLTSQDEMHVLKQATLHSMEMIGPCRRSLTAPQAKDSTFSWPVNGVILEWVRKHSSLNSTTGVDHPATCAVMCNAPLVRVFRLRDIGTTSWTVVSMCRSLSLLLQSLLTGDIEGHTCSAVGITAT